MNLTQTALIVVVLLLVRLSYIADLEGDWVDIRLGEMYRIARHIDSGYTATHDLHGSLHTFHISANNLITTLQNDETGITGDYCHWRGRIAWRDGRVWSRMTESRTPGRAWSSWLHIRNSVMPTRLPGTWWSRDANYLLKLRLDGIWVHAVLSTPGAVDGPTETMSGKWDRETATMRDKLNVEYKLVWDERYVVSLFADKKWITFDRLDYPL